MREMKISFEKNEKEDGVKNLMLENYGVKYILLS